MGEQSTDKCRFQRLPTGHYESSTCKKEQNISVNVQLKALFLAIFAQKVGKQFQKGSLECSYFGLQKVQLKMVERFGKFGVQSEF